MQSGTQFDIATQDSINCSLQVNVFLHQRECELQLGGSALRIVYLHLCRPMVVATRECELLSGVQVLHSIKSYHWREDLAVIISQLEQSRPEERFVTLSVGSPPRGDDINIVVVNLLISMDFQREMIDMNLRCSSLLPFISSSSSLGNSKLTLGGGGFH